jgi:hypothetical protein
MKPRVLTLAALWDGLAAVALLGFGLAGFWPVFGGPAFLRPALSGLAIGAAVAWLGAWRRWNTATVGLGVVVAYLACGGVGALPKHAILGFLPSLTTLRDLVFGAAQVWRQFLTATTPVDTFEELRLVPFIVALVGAAAAFTAAWRAKRPALTLIPAAVVFAGVIVLGTSQPFYPVVQGLGVVVVALVWLAWRRRRNTQAGSVLASNETTAAKVARWRDAVIVLAAAVVAAVFAAPALAAGTYRDVARHYVVPPLDLRSYASPLTYFRSYVDDVADTPLVAVSGFGDAADVSLRLAVLDDFDGMVMNVSSQSGGARYDRVGPELGRRPAATAGTPLTLTVEVLGYSGIWVPGVTALQTLTFDAGRVDDLTGSLYYNADADAVINPAGLQEGDAYTLTAVVPDVSLPDDALGHAVSGVSQPTPSSVPAAVGDLAGQFAGETAIEPVERIANIMAELQQRGFFSHGLAGQEPSRPGHSAARIAELLADSERMVGDDEQYAVAAALMLRELGIPARVVMGFRAGEQSRVRNGVWTVTGSDVHAWVEVPFDGLGWVAFDPVPDEDQEPMEETPQSRSDPKPQVLQPPPPAGEVEEDDPINDPEDRDSEDEEKPEGIAWGVILRWTAIIGLPVAVLMVPPLLILILKLRRTNRRRAAADLSRRLSGGWQELLDRAADLGTVVPPSATRRQAGAVLEARYGGDKVSLVALADRADRGTFAVAEPTAAEVQAYWDDVATARTSLARSVPWFHRLRSRVALTSLKKNPEPNAVLEVDDG